MSEICHIQTVFGAVEGVRETGCNPSLPNAKTNKIYRKKLYLFPPCDITRGK